MGDIQIVRWKRYGKDRIYVKDATGGELGWVDLLTGERNVAVPEQRDAFDAAVNAWYVDTAMPRDARPEGASAPDSDMPPAPGAQMLPQPSVPHTPAPELVSEPAVANVEQPAWHDVATHVPGQAAREQALRELAAMRQRTRVGTFIARALDIKTDERAWRVGAGGEETVGARLERLEKHGWHVLHAVPVGSRGSDIDHVVIGVGGVFTLNTKTHPGAKVWVGARAIRVNGQPVPYIQSSRHEGERARQLLTHAVGFPVRVQPALVFLTGTFIPNVTIKQQPSDVRVLDRMDIPRVFKRARRQLSPEQVAAIYDAARRCTTWTGSLVCACASSAGD